MNDFRKKLSVLRAENEALRKDSERLNSVRLNALHCLAVLLKFLPENPQEHAGLEYCENAYSAHRILATGEPDGKLKTQSENSCAAMAKGEAK